MFAAREPFPVLRWAGLLWLLVWLPAYARVWGWANQLLLCDTVVILSCAGLWMRSRLLLSSQAVGALAPGLLWGMDVAWRLFAGRHLFGGTEYLWDARFPLWVRLFSLFHLVLPAILLWILRQLGYDRRGLALQSAFAAAVLVVSRFLPPQLNLNYAFRDPLLHRAWGPAPAHLALIFSGLVVALYLPAHVLFCRIFPLRGGDETKIAAQAENGGSLA